MSGIYIHIPFCKQACSYCDFHFSTNLKLQDALVEAICLELTSRAAYIEQPPLSIYFGGGSPSILSSRNLSKIFDSLHQSFDLSEINEITFESNPDDHTSENLLLWKKLGVSRLSIGIQSFIDRDLQLMNRAHDAREAEQCVTKARDAGFEHLTIDFIYGIPNQSFAEWKSNIEAAIKLGTDHISAYCLTIEPKTAMAYQIRTGLFNEKSDEEIEQEFLYLHQRLEEANFMHYEISNFARPGHFAQHNQNYWSGKKYLGIGPAAHSFDGNQKRSWNVSNNALYIKGIKTNDPNFDFEVLTVRDRYNEEIMTGLRRKDGFNFGTWETSAQEEILRNIEQITRTQSEVIQCSGSNVAIHPEKWLVADHLIRALMLD